MEGSVFLLHSTRNFRTNKYFVCFRHDGELFRRWFVLICGPLLDWPKIRSVSVGDSQPITVYSGTLLKESYYLFTATICVGFFLRDSASRNTLISSVAPSKMHASFFNPAGHKSIVFKWPGPSSTLSNSVGGSRLCTVHGVRRPFFPAA